MSFTTFAIIPNSSLQLRSINLTLEDSLFRYAKKLFIPSCTLFKEPVIDLVINKAINKDSTTQIIIIEISNIFALAYISFPIVFALAPPSTFICTNFNKVAEKSPNSFLVFPMIFLASSVLFSLDTTINSLFISR